ncbi:sugar phosphate nucleotidyltransferase [Flavobacteriales bacterium]|nr:sugar phosphate nucleotidyltransferase [Flavobacteriales bacterium]
MKIIVPMAGMGKRMRPHTLTVPKPLIPIAGKPIVQRLVEDIAKVCDEKIDEVAFIIGDFGNEVEQNLIEIAEGIGAKGSICYQREALGTAHAILCAKEYLSGKVVVAFADTLFKANFTLDSDQEGIIWTSRVEDPSAFGVVKLGTEGTVEAFVEKPEEFVSDQAIIGIYYFKDGEYLNRELQYLIDNDIRIKGGEFGLTDALENMNTKGTSFSIDTVDEWLDCGNKNATVYTNQRVLEFIKEENKSATNATLNNAQIIEPCYLGEGVVIENSTVGPHVSLGAGTKVVDTKIENSIVQSNSIISNAELSNAMIGNFVSFSGKSADASIGDYSQLNLN